jgi:hypothetical protein
VEKKPVSSLAGLIQYPARREFEEHGFLEGSMKCSC